MKYLNESVRNDGWVVKQQAQGSGSDVPMACGRLLRAAGEQRGGDAGAPGAAARRRAGRRRAAGPRRHAVRECTLIITPFICACFIYIPHKFSYICRSPNVMYDFNQPGWVRVQLNIFYTVLMKLQALY